MTGTLTRSDPVRRAGVAVLAALLLFRFAAVLAGDGLTWGLLHLTGSPSPWIGAVLLSNVHVPVVTDVATLVLLAVLLKREGLRLRDLLGPVDPAGTAWRTGVAVVAGLVAFALGGTVAALLISPQAVPAGPAPHLPLWFGLWSLLVLPVTVALAEEFLYRGYLQPRLAGRIGTPAAVLVVATAFALQHVGMAATSWPAVAAKLGATFVFGLAFGLLRVWMRRLAPLMVAHWLIDVLGIGLPVLLLALGS
jgi:uncharacterized protein